MKKNLKLNYPYSNYQNNYNSNNNDRYYGGPYNNMYNPYNNNYRKKPKDPKKRKKQILIWSLVAGFSVVAIIGIGCAIYFSTRRTDSSEQSRYISQRTVSLQFVIPVITSSGYGDSVGAGTGWIINADTTNQIYYIATNLHVAAFVSYQNHSVYDPDDNSTTSYGTIGQSLIGYVDPESIGQYSDSTVDNLSFVTVPTPTVVYITGTDTNWTNLGYPQVYGASQSGTSLYDLGSDFAVLRYDFSNLSTATATYTGYSASYANSSSDISNFQSWLQNYNNNPTKLLTSSIDTLDYQSLYYSMGGFPASTSDTNTVNSQYNQNWARVYWKSFSNFTLDTTRDYNLTAAYQAQYFSASNSYAQANGVYNSPITYVSDTASSTTTYSGGYVNGARGIHLNADSYSGASGSMVITYINDEPYVVGIYWGSVTYEETYTYGAADLFYTSNNGTYNGTTYAGYNTAQWSYDTILSDAQTNNTSYSLAYNYSTTA